MNQAATAPANAPAKPEEEIKILREEGESDLVERVHAALDAATAQEVFDLSRGIFNVPGMSGKKYRYFINRLIHSLPDARYLEVGSWAGSTLCSAIHGNKVKAVAIDDWSLFGGPKDDFYENLQANRTALADVSVIESDFRKVDYLKMPHSFNVYLFDGPHEEADQYDGLAMALPALDDQFVFIVDDWNWVKVRQGTLQAIGRCNLQIRYAAMILTTKNGTQPDLKYIGPRSNWHNGYLISVLQKT